MTSRVRRFLTTTCLVLVLGMTVLAVARVMPTTDSGIGREVPDAVGFDQQPGAAIPQGLRLTDSFGKTQAIESLDSGRPVLLHFVYYRCPMLCHMTRDALIRTINTMSLRPGRDFDVWTISFDPGDSTADAAAVREATIERLKGGLPNGGWKFFTAEADSITELTDAVGFQFEYDAESNQFAHAAGVVIATPDNTVSRYITGVDYAARDLRFALVEASQGSVGSITDQAMLLCYRYDPMKGRYGLAVLSAIRVLGVATVLTVVGCIGYMISRERGPQDGQDLEQKQAEDNGK